MSCQDGSTVKREKLAEVAITESIGQHRRINAIVKNRFSDFHVLEIDPDGVIVRLTDLGPPKETKCTVALEDAELQAILPEGAVEKVSNLQKTIEEHGRKKSIPVEIDVTDLDKDQRTKIHRWISNYSTLSSTTLDKESRKIIFIEYASNRMKNSRRPETRAKFTHCVLYKEGMETSDAIMLIAKKLKMRPSLITYCGTKDKRAKTTQRICVSNTDARRLIEISNYSRTMKLGNFQYSPKHLFLGDLKGNHFKLLLKDANVDDGASACQEKLESALKEAIASFENKGFINYYGLQRFGSFDVPTQMVGKALLQNKWDRVFDLLLKPKPNDPEFMITAKLMWSKNRDPAEIVKLLPSWHRSIESNLMYGLSRHYDQKDYVSAFMRIPRNVRILYVHAFQSYLWNTLASERIRKYGLVPVPGDIVYAGDKTNGPMPFVEDVVPENSDIETVEVPTLSDEHVNMGKSNIPVKTLTEEDLPNYTIFDVLIPLLGTDVDPKDYILRDFYDNLLLENGLMQDCFINYKPRQDAPRGSYRNLIVKPDNVSYRVIPYNPSDDTDKFIPSDYELLLRQDDPDNNQEAPVTDNSEKSKLCVVIEFSLPSSAYATMALREILYDFPTGSPAQNDTAGANHDISKKRSLEDIESGGDVPVKEKHESDAKKPRLNECETDK